MTRHAAAEDEIEHLKEQLAEARREIQELKGHPGSDSAEKPKRLRRTAKRAAERAGGVFIEYGTPEAELLLGALRTANTWALDALAAAIGQKHQAHTTRNHEHVKLVERVSESLGQRLDNSYRMGHIREFAEKHGMTL
jgi:hypothetical protein